MYLYRPLTIVYRQSSTRPPLLTCLPPLEQSGCCFAVIFVDVSFVALEPKGGHSLRIPHQKDVAVATLMG